ncbi:MFS transporter [Acinetobacter sp. ACIN00229]|uniref:MFS transporter n=1 Tax=Acinetobacter sp. ACIN00229 TaxID=2792607 RepID=UPI0018DF60EC|nr:MFS transporter [Acinetobacter sp. ACIN00229]MBI0421293.1 MFS transporter [Acinetobacter sp. ACIN00229]
MKVIFKKENSKLFVPYSVYWLLITRALSTFGASMTIFTINIWVFEKTRSYALFATMILLSLLPNLVLAPIVGVIVDNYNKKYLLAACEGITALIVFFALIIFLNNSFGLFQACCVTFALSTVSSFRWTLMGATIGNIVPSKLLTHVNGIEQSLAGVVEIGAPLIGAVMLYSLGPEWVFSTDILTSIAALVTIIMVLNGKLLAPIKTQKINIGFLHNALYGVRWIIKNPRSFRLLIFTTTYNFAGGVFTVSFIPHFLSFSSKESLGVALALEGAGALLGGILIAKIQYLGNRLEQFIYLYASIFGVLMIIWGGIRSDIGGFIVVIFSGMVVSMLIATAQTIWQMDVPSEIQGKVFAARRMISYSLIPLATLLSIPFSKYITDFLIGNSPLLQKIWGTGGSAGLGMLLSILGIILVIVSLFTLYRARKYIFTISTVNSKESFLS